MMNSSITYSDILVKQRVESWADGLPFDPEEQILMLIEVKFGIVKVNVVDAQVKDDFILLQIESNLWKEPKEFGLLKTGSLVS